MKDYSYQIKIFYITILLILSGNLLGQHKEIDSLKATLLKPEQPVTTKIKTLLNISILYNQFNPVKTAIYAQQALSEAERINNKELILKALGMIGSADWTMSNYAKDVNNAHRRLTLAKELKDTINIIEALDALATDNTYMGYPDKGIIYVKEALKYAESLNRKDIVAFISTNIGDHFLVTNQYDSASFYTKKAIKLYEAIDQNYDVAFCKMNLAEVQLAKKNYKKALEIALEAYKVLGAENNSNILDKSYIAEDLGTIYRELGQYKKSVKMLDIALKNAIPLNAKDEIKGIYKSYYLTEEKAGNIHKAFEYFKKYKIYSDSVYNDKKASQIAALEIQYELKQKEKEIALLNAETDYNDAKIKSQNKVNLVLIIGLFIGFSLLGILYINNQKKKKAYLQLKKHSQEIAIQNRKIEAQKADIERQNFLLAKKNEKLDRLNEEKNYFLGVAAHDLKNPLKQINGLINIIKLEDTSSFTDSQMDCLDKMDAASKRLSTMINDILDVNAIEGKTVNIKPVNLNLSKLIPSLTESFLKNAKDKEITLNQDISPNLRCHLDTTHFIQVYDNLLSNALKFSPSGKDIFIKLWGENGKVSFSIKDEGPGIKETDKPKLFKKFQKLSATPTAGESSTGLGLSIVKNYVEAMNGKVWCDSVEGKGTTFTVQFG